AMTSGNKLYFGQPNGQFALGPQSQSISLAGWSWGCSAFDMDNDTFPDVYIANGHESKQSVRDFEPYFWLHAIYVASSHDDLVKAAYFNSISSRTRGHGYSYGGYEKNKLFLNHHATEFIDIAHLFGVALEEDCRNVVTDDLDGDGKPDILVTTFEAWPEQKQTLRIFRNLIPHCGNWITVCLSPNVRKCSPVGATITIKSGSLTLTKPVVTGDSHRTQHTSQIHFGLGKTDRLDWLLVRWPDGATNILLSPAVNQTHYIRHPSAAP
ncbi:MAG: CRTAC1 family protein, partial [Verrucomicrobiae bacterium]|nr:CRTAC1 family protein [Verrucomicrobiae bacterium]